jgi:excisionase family DNA binding protein
MQSGTWTITAPATRAALASEERMLTIPEVAETCRLSEKAIRRAIDRGQLKAFKLCNRIRISHQDMRDWIASQRQPAVTVSPGSGGAITAMRRAAPRKHPSPAPGSFRALIPDTDRQEHAA